MHCSSRSRFASYTTIVAACAALVGVAAANAAGSTGSAPRDFPVLSSQPSLGDGVVPKFGVLPDNLAPFAELRLRLVDWPARGFGEQPKVDPSEPTSDPSDLLERLRIGLFWHGGDNSALIQGQYTLTDPLQHASDPTARHIDIHQLFYNRADLLNGNLDVRVGRQELLYGEGRLIGSFNWANTGRTFDAIRLVYGHPEAKVDVFFTHTVGFTSPQPMFWFSGLYGSSTRRQYGTVDLYLLDKQNDGGLPFNRQTAGARWKDQFGPVFGVSAEGAGQWGSDISKVGASSNDAGSSAFHLALTQNLTAARVTPHVKNLTLLEEFDTASGSGTPTGDGATFDNVFPTNHAKYGGMDFMGWRNMTDLRLGVSAEPVKKITTSLDWHSLGLASAHDYWYAGSGAPMITVYKTGPNAGKSVRAFDNGTNIGQEVDVTATYKQNQHVAWYGGISEFFAGSYILRTTGRNDASTWVFLQTTLTY